jgi:hypothetical protein
MIVGAIENDGVITFNIGDRLKITTDENTKGKQGIIHVKNCVEFSKKLQE